MVYSRTEVSGIQEPKKNSAELLQQLESINEQTRSELNEVKDEVFTSALEKDAATLNKNDLYTLASRKEGRQKFLSSYTNIESVIKKEEGIQEGQEIAVDFGTNNSAYWNVGMGDMLPENVQTVTVRTEKGETLTGTRAPSPENPFPPRVGYYSTDGEYIPVFTGDTITVGKVATPEEMEAFKTALKEALANGEYSEFADVDWEKLGVEEIENLFQQQTERKNESVGTREEVYAKREKFDDTHIREEFLLEADKKLTENGINPEDLKSQEKMKQYALILAKEIEAKFGIPYQVTLAQTCLETGYFSSVPDGNFFGIKGGKNKKRRTMEEINGKMESQFASFRSYGSMAESFYDYAQFLTKGEPGHPTGRYADAFRYKGSPRRFLEEVIRAGYATDSRYISKASSALRRAYGVRLA